MREYCRSTIIALLLVFGGTASAQTPPTAAMNGSLQNAFVQNGSAWCGADASPSTFQRASTGLTPAYVTLDGVYYTAVSNTARPTYYKLSGQAVLSFSTPTAGGVYFYYPGEYPSAVRAPNFTGYQQTYNAAQKVLSVTFVMQFPSCNLRVTSYYRQ